MKKTFEKLQNQHPAVRTRVALTAAIAITGVIALILLTTLPLRFEDTAALGANSVDSAAVINAASSAAAPQVQSLQDNWASISGIQFNQGGNADASVVGQDQSQDAAYPQDGAEVNSETY